jgi:quercetin dioxygenase-like cupin family protein
MTFCGKGHHMSSESDAAPRARSLFNLPGGGQRIPLGDAGVVTLKAIGKDTGGSLTVYEFVTPARTAGPPLHLHRTMDEAFYVLEGEMTFIVGDEITTAPAGAFVFVPRGVLHTFWNESELPARQLTVFTPSGIEHYFEEVTDVLATGGADALEAAAVLMEKHDMIVPPANRPAYESLSFQEHDDT